MLHCQLAVYSLALNCIIPKCHETRNAIVCQRQSNQVQNLMGVGSTPTDGTDILFTLSDLIA
jgi:hypothetical protein